MLSNVITAQLKHNQEIRTFVILPWSGLYPKYLPTYRAQAPSSWKRRSQWVWPPDECVLGEHQSCQQLQPGPKFIVEWLRVQMLEPDHHGLSPNSALISCVTWGKLFNLPVPQVLQFYNGTDKVAFIKVREDKLVNICKAFSTVPAHGKCPVNVPLIPF